jgi:S-(hydroxymethyl)glutathione dehydrogenase/alcohol dehydrogenase
MKAAVLHKTHDPIQIDDVTLDNPASSEVIVRTMAAGVCHSDLHLVEGLITAPLPCLLGHESAGIVEEVGSGVTDFKAGDHVIACLSIFCGKCERCLSGRPNVCLNRPVRDSADTPRVTLNGERVEQFANIGGYAEQMLLHENTLVKIDKDVSFEVAALIGCGVTTGVGAVLNTAKVEAGSSVAVFGVGGIGLSAIQGARIAGAIKIIAVDLAEHKLAKAMEVGATHVVDASSHDPVEAVRDLTDGGVDYAFEAVGIKETSEQAYQATRGGGVCTIVGVLPEGVNIEIEGRSLLSEKRLQGSSMGSNRFRIDMPRYIEMYRQGNLMVNEIITRRGKLEDINDLYAAQKNREEARSVILFD